MRNILLVISGPSGVGKGTLKERLLLNEENLVESVSCTTRKPRTGEKEGVNYFFVSDREFQSRIEENDFLEYDEHFGRFYGTPRSFVERMLKDKSVILEIDVVGGLNAKRLMPERTVLVMIVPPSMDELKKRLKGRGSENEEEIKNRLVRVKYEMEQESLYDYVIVNDDFEEAYNKLKEIYHTEINK